MGAGDKKNRAPHVTHDISSRYRAVARRQAPLNPRQRLMSVVAMLRQSVEFLRVGFFSAALGVGRLNRFSRNAKKLSVFVTARQLLLRLLPSS
jgi:hypothetical protein